METEVLLFAGGAVVGVLGALLGIGGGILIVPLLTLGFGEPLSRAIGTSLVAVVATSAGAAAHNVRAGRADVRLGLTLEIGTVLGAAAGGLLAGLLAERVLAGLFAALMAYVALSLLGRTFAPADEATADEPVDPMAPDGPAAPAYRSRRLPLALGGSVGAGAVSALLGVGGGIVKVPLMRLVMGAPMHVATATSNFMIGVTAAAGAYAYLFRGDVEPMVAAPLALGVLGGAAVGARIAHRIETRWLTILFVVVAGWVAVEMGLRAAGVAR
jgi:hypothetical protein